MLVKILFRLFDKQHSITNMLGMEIDTETDGKFEWRLFGLSGKVVRLDNPIAKGTGSYQVGRADLFSNGAEPYGRLVFSKELRNLDKESEGTYIDNRMNKWAAYFIGREVVQSQGFSAPFAHIA